MNSARRVEDDSSLCDELWIVEAMRDVVRDRSTERKADFDAHLETCSRCRVELERLRRMDAVWGACRREEEGHLPLLESECASVRSIPVSRVGRRWWVYAAATVALAGIVSGGVMMRGGEEDVGAESGTVALRTSASGNPGPLPSAHATSIAPIDFWKPATRDDVSLEGSAAPASSSGDESGRYESARRALEPRVKSGVATTDELKMLRAICRQQRDLGCVSRVTRLLAARLDGGAGNGGEDPSLEERAEVAANYDINMLLAFCAAEGDRKCVETLYGQLWRSSEPSSRPTEESIVEWRRELESAVTQGTASRAQLYLLRAVCRRQRDARCAIRITRRIQESGSSR